MQAADRLQLKQDCEFVAADGSRTDQERRLARYALTLLDQIRDIEKLCNEDEKGLSNVFAWIKAGTPYEADPAQRHHAELIINIRKAIA